jgi:hypothetical protein
MTVLRRPRHLPVAIVLVLAILVACALVFRLALADMVLARYLSGIGIPGHARFTALGPDRARLEHVRLEELTAERIEIEWQVSLAHGIRPVHIAVQAPVLALDLTRETGPFAGIRNTLKASTDRAESEAFAVLPLLSVEGGRASVTTRAGEFVLDLTLSSHRSDDESLAYGGVLSALGPGLAADVDFQGALQGLEPTRLDADLQIRDPDSTDRATGTLRIRAVDEELEVLADLTGRVSAELASRLGLLDQDVAGQLRIELSSESVWPGAFSNDSGTLSPLRLQAQFDLAADDLRWASFIEDGDLDWAGSIDWAGGREAVQIRPSRPLAVNLGKLGDALLPADPAGRVMPGALDGLSLTLDTPEITVDPVSSITSMSNASVRLRTTAADEVLATGSAILDLGDGLAAETLLDIRFKLAESIRGLRALDGALTAELVTSGAATTVSLHDQFSLSLIPDRSVLPDSLAFLAGERLRLHANRDPDHMTAADSDASILDLSLVDDQVYFDYDADLAVDSRFASQLGIKGTAVGKMVAETLVIDVAEAQLNAVNLEMPRIRLDQLAAQGQGRLTVGEGAERGAAQIVFAPVAVVLDGRMISLGAGEAELSGVVGGQAMLELRLTSLEAAEQAVSARDIVLSGHRSDDGVDTLLLKQATMDDLWLPARFPPISVTGNASQGDASASATLRVSPVAAPVAALDVDVTYNRRREIGRAEFSTSGLVFSEGLQPKALWPGLTLLEKVFGELALRGEVRFDSEGLIDSGGRMDLSLSSFESDGLQVSGFSMPLRLSSLWPVESFPDQRLSIARVADGAELTDVELDYRLIPKPAGPPLLEIAQAGMNLLGGRVRMGRTTYDPDGQMETALVEAEGLDLVSVLSLITSEGLGGQGRLKGRFPVRLQDGSLVVEDALLEAEAPGILRFDSPQAAQTLSAAGDHVNLLLSALRNFHYDTLTLSADKSAAGETTLLLSLAGHNPDVLEGYPFKLNIGLETDAAPLLAMFRQGTDLFDEVIKRVWRPGATIR